MKKTLLALAIPAALVAGSANAAINVYSANGVTVDFGGAVEVQQRKTTNENEDATLRIDDGDLFVNTTVEVAPGLKVLGTLGYFFESDGNDSADVKSDELFVGFQSDFGTLTFGRQYLLADGAGNGKDYEQGLNDVSFGDTQSSRVIKWYYDNGGAFYLGASATLSDDNSANTASEGYGYEGLIGLRAGGFDSRIFLYSGNNMAGGFKQTATSNNANQLQDINGFNFEIDYAFNDFDFSAAYGLVNFEGSVLKNTTGSTTTFVPVRGDENKVTTYEIAAGYQADDRTYFAAGAIFLDSKAKGNYQDYKGYDLYTNVTYKLHSNAKMYAEIALTDQEIGSKEQPVQDLGYVLGMEVSF